MTNRLLVRGVNSGPPDVVGAFGGLLFLGNSFYRKEQGCEDAKGTFALNPVLNPDFPVTQFLQTRFHFIPRQVAISELGLALA